MLTDSRRWTEVGPLAGVLDGGVGVCGGAGEGCCGWGPLARMEDGPKDALVRLSDMAKNADWMLSHSA